MNAEAAPASQKKILVVDDNEVILKTISLKLQGAGFNIITALYGSEAVAAARKETPDLILLDINFPRPWTACRGTVFASWIGFIAWIRRRKFPSSSPVLKI
jgi:CheY-like chemotaxis protein